VNGDVGGRIGLDHRCRLLGLSHRDLQRLAGEAAERGFQLLHVLDLGQ